MSKWRVRDPIHGFIELDRREVALLDTAPLQRLRGIRQLAMASLVYPGALHTRFDHTLGVTDVAGRMCRALNVEEDATRLIRLAALLHDVGHGPFSHVSESVLQAVNGSALSGKAKRKDKIHELVTREIILRSSGLSGPVSANDREEVARLLASGWDKRLHRDVVSGPLDADKQDYLLRDSHFCGVSYGHFDVHQLHASLRTVDLSEDEVLGLEGGGLNSLEQFVLAKYYMTTQVYRHKVRLITDQMLTRALHLGSEADALPFLQRLYRYPLGGGEREIRDYVENYLEWHDARLEEEILRVEHRDSGVAEIFRRLRGRRLFKRVFETRVADLPPNLKTIVPNADDRDSRREEVETRIADLLSCITGTAVPSRFVVFHFYKIESVRSQSRNSEGSIQIASDGGCRNFEDASMIFASIDEGLKEEKIEVYAPVAYRDDKEKKTLLRRCREEIPRILEEAFSPLPASSPESRPDP